MRTPRSLGANAFARVFPQISRILHLMSNKSGLSGGGVLCELS
jgi:hypothetical protein